MEKQVLHYRIGRLIEAMPDLETAPLDGQIYKWLGDASALVKNYGDISTQFQLEPAIKKYVANVVYKNNPGSSARTRDSIREIYTILYQLLSILELELPVEVQGNFIPAGNSFDVLVGLSKIFDRVGKDILIVDPYLDNKVLTEYATMLRENISIRLLTDEKKYKSTVKTAAKIGLNNTEKIVHLS